MGTLWPVDSSLDQMLDTFVLNKCIKLHLAVGTVVLCVPAQALGPSWESCLGGHMRLGPK